jgi:hypothetical protein
MVQLELPHVNLLTKCDLADNKEDLERYLSPSTHTLAADLAANTPPRHRALNMAFCRLLEEYDMVAFLPLDITDEESIGAVLMQVDHAIAYGEELEPKEPSNPPGRAEIYDGFDLDWQAVRSRFGLFLAHSWLGLLLGIMIIIYLARNWLGDPLVPWWVRLILYNLLVTYSLFGIFATACYALGSQWWVSEGLGGGLVVLSAAAKLPVKTRFIERIAE